MDHQMRDRLKLDLLSVVLAAAKSQTESGNSDSTKPKADVPKIEPSIATRNWQLRTTHVQPKGGKIFILGAET